jgi:Zn-dependent M28 family amino/carboxypeptidase
VDDLKLVAKYPVEFTVPPVRGSDHWPFYVAGIPSVLTAWDPIPHYHRNGDRVEACNRDDKYAAALSAVQAILQRLKEAPAPS